MTSLVFIEGLFTHIRYLTFLVVLLVSPHGVAQTPKGNCPPPLAAPTMDDIKSIARDAKDRGYLWRVEKDGRVSHLFGSIHVGKRAWSIPGPKTMAALDASDVIALELDPLDPVIRAQLSDLAKFGIQSFELPPRLKARVISVAKEVCAPVELLAPMHPVMQLVTVILFDARFSGLEPGYGSEIFIAGFARGVQKPIDSLETAELQLHALLDGESKEMIEAIDHSVTLIESGKSRTVMDRMTRTWAGGDLAALQDYPKWCECADTEAERKVFLGLNDQRNPGLATSIDELMRSGKTVFAAVGALHMTGPKALPKLLADRGYKVERVLFERKQKVFKIRYL